MLRPLYLLPLVFLLGCCDGVGTGHHRAKRSSPDFDKRVWDTTVPIPYTLDTQFTDAQKTMLRNSIQTIADKTCITFKEDYTTDAQKIAYYLNNTKSCEGKVLHKLSGGDANVTLQNGCVQPTGIHHETMHALGFRHTQTRPDRDNYVIVADAVKDTSNFRKIEKDANYIDYGIAYEFSSPLHYRLSKNLRPIDPDYNTSLFGNFMMFNDWKLVNLHYKCDKKCTTPLDCLNGGYRHAPNCEQCVCPHFYSGNRCEVERNPVDLAPGQVLPLYEEFQLNGELYNKVNEESIRRVKPIKFEDFQVSPSKIIKAPEGSRIRVRIEKIDGATVDEHPSKCDWMALEIVDGGDLTRGGKRFCGTDRAGYEFLSTTNVLGYRVFAQPYLGFLANVTFTVDSGN